MNCEGDFANPRQCTSIQQSNFIDHHENSNCEYDLIGDINRLSDEVSINSKTVCILKELNKIYEDRLTDVDKRANGDSHLKYITCMEWVDILKRIINDLLTTIDELEIESFQRISLLERKLQIEYTTKTHTNEVGSLKNDISNLLEFIRRAIEDGKWDTKGLYFLTISENDIVGRCIEDESIECDLNVEPDVKKLQSNLFVKNHEIKKLKCKQHILETELSKKELLIQGYINKIKDLENQSGRRSSCKAPIIEPISENNRESDSFKYESYINELKKSLEEKEMQLANTLKDNECLQSELHVIKNKNVRNDQATANMKALAFEVAEKHDQIQHMKSQIFSMEDELKKAHRKIQFKDNVIKELRKECKSIPKCSCNTKSSNTSRSNKCEVRSCYLSAVEDVEELDQIHSYLNLTTLSADDSDETITQTTSLDTVLTCRMVKASHELESHYMKILKDELDELFKLISTAATEFKYGNSSGGGQSIECQRKKIELQQNKLEELVKRMLVDLRKINAKLTYVRKQLSSMISANCNEGESDTDSGYLSYEDMEPESTIIKSIRLNMQNLKSENCEQKQHIHKLQMDIQRCNCEKTSTIETNNKILRNVIDVLSKLCGKEIYIESTTSDENSNLKLQNYLYEVLSCAENLFFEREKSIQKLKIEIDDLKKELQCVKANITVLECEIQAKDQTIFELQQTIDECKNTMDLIEKAKNDLQVQLEKTVETGNDLKYAELVEAKTRLESEPNMELEILCDQVVEKYNEVMRLEEKVTKLRDDNLNLQGVLIDYENGLQDLEDKYAKSSVMEKEYLDKERNYREIIDDLTNELANLSSHVTISQDEFKDDSTPFESTFRELESQNDLLQNTIESLQAETIKLHSNLKDKEFQVQQLKHEITSLQTIIEQRTKNVEELKSKCTGLICNLQQIRSRCKCGAGNLIKIDEQDLSCIHNKKSYEFQHIFEMLDRKDNELKALKEYSNDEKNRSRKLIADLEDQIKQLNIKLSLTENTLKKRDHDLEVANTKLLEYTKQNGELKCKLIENQENIILLQTEEKRLEDMVKQLCNEIAEVKEIRKERETELIEDINEQVKALINANDTIVILEKQINSCRKQNDHLTNENALLKTENDSLKKDLRAQKEIEKSLREQLQKTQNELLTLKYNLQSLNTLPEEIENFKRNCNRLKESNYIVARKYNELVDDYNKLEEEYRKLLDINDQMLKEIETTRKWQLEQREQDQLISAKIKKMEDHIKTLMEDRQALIVKINELHRDLRLLSDELERYKELFDDVISEAHERTSSFTSEYQSSNVDSLIRKIRRTTWKASQTRSIWEAETTRRFSD